MYNLFDKNQVILLNVLSFFIVLDSSVLNIGLILKEIFCKCLRNYVHFAFFKTFGWATFEYKETGANVY